tara:strand:+ start:11505 stop:12638 length:1134 start_codon:yes stop_codon:yes gene_type:complete
LKKQTKIWLSSPHIGAKELEYVNDAFISNWVAPVGPHIDSFEQELSRISSGYNVAALSSGTASIHLALILIGVQQHDDVLCSTFTFSATVNPIKYLNANPILIDSEEDTWNMCPDLLEIAIKKGISRNKKPKAIIVVHLYGMPAQINKIVAIANKYNIPVIEDAAEALGSTYNSQPLGTFGDFGVYSFNGNKIITTSGGGALVSKNKEMIAKARFLATQARDKAPHYEHSEIGYNYRLSNISAAIGLGQLEILNQRVLKKREINKYYKKELSSIKQVSFLDEHKGSFSNFWLTTILLDKNSAIDREYLRLKLAKANIESRPLWKPMHLQPVFKECKFYVNGVSEQLFERGLCLPSGTNMADEDIKRVIRIIKCIYEA